MKIKLFLWSVLKKFTVYKQNEIEFELLVLDRNIWNHLNACK